MEVNLLEIENEQLSFWLETTRGRYGHWSNIFPSFFEPHTHSPEKYSSDYKSIPFYKIQNELRRRGVAWD